MISYLLIYNAFIHKNHALQEAKTKSQIEVTEERIAICPNNQHPLQA